MTTSGPLTGELSGAGAAFPQPVYVEWTGAFQKLNPGLTMNYQGVGSGAGVQQFTEQTVDFGASDLFMTPDEIQAAETARPGAKVEQIPTVFGAVVLVYNLAGNPKLNLDADTVVGIYLGKITRWNDPALMALNPDLKLPNADIKVFHRTDSSFTTYAYTSYLSLVSPDWAAGPGFGKNVQWPVGVGSQGGSAYYWTSIENSIGYVEYAYAHQNRMTVASIKNRAGNFIAPSLDSAGKAAEGFQVPADMNLEPLVMNSANPDAYPIVHGTYILVYDKMPAAKATLFKNFMTWALGDEGTKIAQDLGYVPLPADLKAAALELVDAIGSQ